METFGVINIILIVSLSICKNPFWFVVKDNTFGYKSQAVHSHQCTLVYYWVWTAISSKLIEVWLPLAWFLIVPTKGYLTARHKGLYICVFSNLNFFLIANSFLTSRRPVSYVVLLCVVQRAIELHVVHIVLGEHSLQQPYSGLPSLYCQCHTWFFDSFFVSLLW